MRKNIGLSDKIVRIVLAIVIAVLYYTDTINATIAIILGAFAVILLLTSFINFCLLYLPFGISTRKKVE